MPSPTRHPRNLVAASNPHQEESTDVRQGRRRAGAAGPGRPAAACRERVAAAGPAGGGCGLLIGLAVGLSVMLAVVPSDGHAPATGLPASTGATPAASATESLPASTGTSLVPRTSVGPVPYRPGRRVGRVLRSLDLRRLGWRRWHFRAAAERLADRLVLLRQLPRPCLALVRVLPLSRADSQLGGHPDTERPRQRVRHADRRRGMQLHGGDRGGRPAAGARRSTAYGTGRRTASRSATRSSSSTTATGPGMPPTLRPGPCSPRSRSPSSARLAAARPPVGSSRRS